MDAVCEVNSCIPFLTTIVRCVPLNFAHPCHRQYKDYCDPQIVSLQTQGRTLSGLGGQAFSGRGTNWPGGGSNLNPSEDNQQNCSDRDGSQTSCAFISFLIVLSAFCPCTRLGDTFAGNGAGAMVAPVAHQLGRGGLHHAEGGLPSAAVLPSRPPRPFCCGSGHQAAAMDGAGALDPGTSRASLHQVGPVGCHSP